MNIILLFFAMMSFLLNFNLMMVGASVIEFTATSGQIQPPLTTTLGMTCNVSDTSPSQAVVGRRDVLTSGDNMHVTSILIVRDGKVDVATVNQYVGVKAMADNDGHLKVDGSIKESAGQRGYLHAEWSYPTSQQVGDYVCKVSGITDAGHMVSLSKSLAIDTVAPTIDKLAEHLHQLEVTLKNNVTELKKNVTELERENKDLSSRVSSLEQEKVSMESTISKIQHIENGTIDCKHGWGYIQDPRDGNYYINTVTKTFSKTYSKPPIVHFSPVEVDYYEANKELNWHDYNFYLEHFDGRGFTVTCRVFHDIKKVERMKLSWISLPVA